MFSLWVIRQLIPNLIQKLPELIETKELDTIIRNMEKKEWNTARQNWYTKIMKKDLSNTKKIDFIGEVEHFFLRYMYIFQTHNLIQKCSKDCIYNGNMILSDNSSIIGFAKLRQKNIAIISSDFTNCLLYMIYLINL